MRYQTWLGNSIDELFSVEEGSNNYVVVFCKLEFVTFP